MTAAPRVSVVIPFYDGAATIQRAVDSLGSQTVPPAEIVIVDDGSPSELPELRSDIPIVRIAHERNRGIPAARNTGIAASSGDRVGFLDQDDEWEPTKLERQMHAVPDGDARAIAFGRLLHTGQGVRPWRWPPNRAVPLLERGGDAAMRAFVRWGNAAPFVTLLIARPVLQAIGPLDESLRGGGDDLEYVMRAVAQGVRLVHDAPDDAGLYSAIHHFTGRNYSAHAPRWIDDNVRLVETLAASYPLVERWRGPALARARYTLGRFHDRNGDVEAARSCYRDAARLDPLWWRPRAARLWLEVPGAVRQFANRGSARP